MLRQFIQPLSSSLCCAVRSTSTTQIQAPGQQLILVATIKKLAAAQKLNDVEFPASRRRLRPLEKAPQPLPGQRMPKMFKRLIDMRGPEIIHNKLIHKQYGIRAIMGGQLRHGHNEMMRLTINRQLDEARMFAVWRVDPPWKPITRKGQGHRMGGGKGAIDHYTTPVKAGRIILEVAGHCDYEEVFYLLRNVAQKLPFKAQPICQEVLDLEAEQQQHVAENNVNPFNFEYCLKNNFLGSRLWASPYDYMWHGKHR